ncbi:MAG: GspH/FimT family protein, partial [Gammaproteobacteria bacterium]
MNRFSGALQYARSEAVRRSRRVVLCPSTNGRVCAHSERWAQGWIVFADLDGDRERTRSEPLLRTAAGLAEGISMHSSRHRRRIRNQALGNTHGTNASFTFCDTHGRARPR